MSKEANMAAWAESVQFSDPDADVSEEAYDRWFEDEPSAMHFTECRCPTPHGWHAHNADDGTKNHSRCEPVKVEREV